jgi:iron complex transport system substrate-binding protein
MRICSLLPSATEIISALGLGDDIVGVTHECDYPQEARHKPIVVRSLVDSNRLSSSSIDAWAGERLRKRQSLYTIDEAAFREARPDLILTQELCEVCAVDYNEVTKVAESLTEPAKILSLSPHCLTDVLRDIERVGAATARHDRAEALVQQLQGRIEQVRHTAAQSKGRPRVACLEWLEPIYAAGHWVPEMVELAGGMDPLGRKGEPSARVTWSTLQESAPDIIVLMPCGFEIERTIQERVLLQKMPQWNHLPAVKSNKVYAVNSNAFFSRPGPRLVDGLEILARIVHPEIFSESSPADAAQRIL